MAEPVRCWASNDDAYNAYHDDEWGRPVTDESSVLERLCLEGFQSGLSWLTILRKRPAFRDAFAAFDPDTVARFDGHDVERLLTNAAIVRHPGKIEAAIANARGTLELRERGTPLNELVWSYRPDDHRSPRSREEWQSTSPESNALSKALKRVGFRFVGPTTVYSTMQACGVVNDHLVGCHVHDEVEREIAAAGLRSSH
ncbi:MAG: DNA-3-methyladenine glycosylase I [Actinobacteria bacterium]|nr:MAG: DNA-3-methyladenine glycosylase I [Actinomycetota bacterium]